MIFVHAIPAYRGQLHIGVAHCMQRDALWAAGQGWNPRTGDVDVTGIARARNIISESSIALGARLLLMQDSDTFPDITDSGLSRMFATMTETQAAVVGAAVPIRNGESVNCEPYRPGEVYEGVVGTGYMLLDLVKLANVPRPWFRQVDSDNGLSVICGEDIGFCKLASAHGCRVVVDARIHMIHAFTVLMSTRG